MSCSAIQTIQAGDGSKTQFAFDFPYIFRSEIHVYFWNTTTKEWDEVLSTDATYPWEIADANPNIINFTSTAPPSPTSPVDPNETTEDNIKIRRITKINDIRAFFNPGSAIRSNDLNKNFEQLRYAIQESNCQGIPDDVDEYLKDYYWNNFDSTVYSTETWDSDDDQVATTQAIDARVDAKIDTAITTDIGTDGTGITVTDDGDGTITLGLADDTIDFSKIKDEDKVELSEQVASYNASGSDNTVFTSLAAARRFDNYVQNDTPSTTDGIGHGRVWVDVENDQTLSVWNGSAWVAVTSGGTFTNQPKVVYVDATAGDDSNDGHRISRPKQTIKAAITQINNDATYGDGSVVAVAAGVYQEEAPIQIQKKNVSIIGQALRSCIVHPTVATQGDQSAGNHALFELNSGSFIQNLTLTGMKANNTGTNTIDSVLPANQGWNFAFYAGATITKSPYIQNCTNFSDSEIDNSNLNANTPAGGLAGDTDSAPTGGGMLVDGSVVATTSPLRSMVADSYTHVGLNGPGILVTNNGYAQCTSSYAFFNKYHIKTLNGGQANLAASTTDFGDLALVADGKSTAAIFTSNVDGAAADGDITFNINEPTAGVGWFGDTERPASNMLVEVNSVTYPILSAVANTDSEGGAGWTVTISRPNPSNRSENLGLNGAVADDAAVSFFLRSMIASSGHTMEYVGSGTDYRALPENGGVPDESKQITESNNGKVWTAITDHNGKFKVGGNQTDDPIFEVDQQLGFVTIPEGSIAFNLLSDETPQLGGNLDVNGNTITSTSNANVVLDPNGTGTVDVSTSRITSVTDPTDAQDAATKNYVDNFTGTSDNIGDSTVTTAKIADDAVTAAKLADTTVTAGSYTTADITVDAQGRVTAAASGTVVLAAGQVGTDELADDAVTAAKLADTTVTAGSYTAADITIDAQGRVTAASNGNTDVSVDSSPQLGGNLDVNGNEITSALNGNVVINPNGTGNIVLDADVGIGTTSPSSALHLSSSAPVVTITDTDTSAIHTINADSSNANVSFSVDTTGVGDTNAKSSFIINTHGEERLRVQGGTGNVGIGTNTPSSTLEVNGTCDAIKFRGNSGTAADPSVCPGIDNDTGMYRPANNVIGFATTASERARIDSSGNFLVATTDISPIGNNALGLCIRQAGGNINANMKSTNNPHGFRRNDNGDLFRFYRNSATQVGSISVTSSATAFNTSSDYRLKENIVDLDGAITRVKQLAPKRFNFIVNPDATVDGFLAHEAQTVVPEAVTGTQDETENIGTLTEWDGTVLETNVSEPAADQLTWEETITDEDGNETVETRTRTWTQTSSQPVYQGIDQAKLVPLLTAALQEAITKIETLETKVAALESAS